MYTIVFAVVVVSRGRQGLLFLFYYPQWYISNIYVQTAHTFFFFFLKNFIFCSTYIAFRSHSHTRTLHFFWHSACPFLGIYFGRISQCECEENFAENACVEQCNEFCVFGWRVRNLCCFFCLRVKLRGQYRDAAIGLEIAVGEGIVENFPAKFVINQVWKICEKYVDSLYSHTARWT